MSPWMISRCVRLSSWKLAPASTSSFSRSDRSCRAWRRYSFFIEGDDFLDRAHSTAEVFAQAKYFSDNDGRAGKGLQYAVLSTLNSLGDFDFALASEQRNRTHLAQVHADGVVGFFEGARGE